MSAVETVTGTSVEAAVVAVVVALVVCGGGGGGVLAKLVFLRHPISRLSAYIVYIVFCSARKRFSARGKKK